MKTTLPDIFLVRYLVTTFSIIVNTSKCLFSAYQTLSKDHYQIQNLINTVLWELLSSLNLRTLRHRKNSGFELRQSFPKSYPSLHSLAFTQISSSHHYGLTTPSTSLLLRASMSYSFKQNHSRNLAREGQKDKVNSGKLKKLKRERCITQTIK